MSSRYRPQVVRNWTIMPSVALPLAPWPCPGVALGWPAWGLSCGWPYIINNTRPAMNASLRAVRGARGHVQGQDEPSPFVELLWRVLKDAIGKLPLSHDSVPVDS